MPPSERPIPRFAAEPPQEHLPTGRWADSLRAHFLEAVGRIEAEEELGEAGVITWFPDRTIGGRTYIPASAITGQGLELFGFVSFEREHSGAEAAGFLAEAEYTDETAEANPDWRIDLRDHEIGEYRGGRGRIGKLALVFGEALIGGSAVATAELGPTTTDQCEVEEGRFTLISLDEYTGDLLEVRLWGPNGAELAAESLYEGE